MKYYKITLVTNKFADIYESSCENKELAIAVSTLRILEKQKISDLTKIIIEKIIVENFPYKPKLLL